TLSRRDERQREEEQCPPDNTTPGPQGGQGSCYHGWIHWDGRDRRRRTRTPQRNGRHRTTMAASRRVGHSHTTLLPAAALRAPGGGLHARVYVALFPVGVARRGAMWSRPALPAPHHICTTKAPPHQLWPAHGVGLPSRHGQRRVGEASARACSASAFGAFTYVRGKQRLALRAGRRRVRRRNLGAGAARARYGAPSDDDDEERGHKCSATPLHIILGHACPALQQQQHLLRRVQTLVYANGGASRAFRSVGCFSAARRATQRNAATNTRRPKGRQSNAHRHTHHRL
ncbi:hypothetical protein U9M48_029073, partial [Paspalum notatum var. saurae]